MNKWQKFLLWLCAGIVFLLVILVWSSLGLPYITYVVAGLGTVWLGGGYNEFIYNQSEVNARFEKQLKEERENAKKQGFKDVKSYRAHQREIRLKQEKPPTLSQWILGFIGWAVICTFIGGIIAWYVGVILFFAVVIFALHRNQVRQKLQASKKSRRKST